jgi:excinuclease UvrABC ATPase subunit
MKRKGDGFLPKSWKWYRCPKCGKKGAHQLMAHIGPAVDATCKYCHSYFSFRECLDIEKEPK